MESLNNRLGEEEKISEQEHKFFEKSNSVPLPKNEETVRNTENSVRDFWDTIKRQNIHVLGGAEGEERQNILEGVFSEIKAKNFPKFEKERDMQL